jgi:hypothetical protein
LNGLLADNIDTIEHSAAAQIYRHAATVSPLSPSADSKNAYTSNSYSEEEQNHVTDFYCGGIFFYGCKIHSTEPFIAKHDETSQEQLTPPIPKS